MADELVVRTRADVIREWQRDYLRRVPDADVGPDTQPYLDGSLAADALMPLYNNARVAYNDSLLESASEPRLRKIASEEGVTWPPASGASGFVTITASSGGAMILDTAELVEPQSRSRFRCQATAIYFDGDEVPITGIDTGPATNLKPGTVLQWSSPPPGIGPTAEVAEQAGGYGLVGGRDEATPGEVRELIREHRANPPASGNDAAYQALVDGTGGLGIQKCFTYPAIKGAGTTFVTCTISPATPGGSRLPPASTLVRIRADLEAGFPVDDGILVGSITGQNFAFVLKVAWAPQAPGWVDAVPWPPTIADDVAVTTAVTPTATTFRLTTSTAGTTAPQVGQTIGFYNKTTNKFVRKRIGAVAVVVAGQTWDITCDTSNNASDTQYVPFHDQVVSPWSDSLDLVVGPIVAYVDGLGPGEQVATSPDPGRRQKRSPASPVSWPHQITNRVLEPLFKVSAILDVELKSPTVPYSTTVGTPGIVVFLLQMNDLAVLKQ